MVNDWIVFMKILKLNTSFWSEKLEKNMEIELIHDWVFVGYQL
jgi:G:T-mismatch repair DNA endonuclease (very short patch repair protein)